MEGNFGFGYRWLGTRCERSYVLLRVTTDVVIDTDDDPHEVCETLARGAKEMLAGFPHGDIVKFEVLSQERVSDEDAPMYAREYTE